MPAPTVAIVGGGLAGLTAAHRLHQAGIGFSLFEARERLGGRILSIDASGVPAADGFDLGPSWFWPGMSSAITPLIDELGLTSFPQYAMGDLLFQRNGLEPPQRYASYRQEPDSMRLAGGVGTLVASLAAGLPQGSVELSSRVAALSLVEYGVEMTLVDMAGAARAFRAQHVILAMPPRLLADSVAFSPRLDTRTLHNWRATPTWMAPHAKLVALYRRPFWRSAGLSGDASSQVGPLVEVHDATTASGKAALFGFLGLSARDRATLGQDPLIEASISQLVQMFGPEAATPERVLYKDWAADPLTATDDDRDAGGHPIAGGLAPVPGEWHGRLLLAGSEAGRREAGYLAGAVEAAEYAVLRTINELEAAP